MAITNEDLNEFNTSVVKLCNETTKLHNEIKDQKSRFDQKLSQSVAAADKAEQYRDEASSHRTSAQRAEIDSGRHANRSEQAANRAEEVTGMSTAKQLVDAAMIESGVADAPDAIQSISASIIKTQSIIVSLNPIF